MATTLTINGEQKSFDAPAEMPLLWVLRDIIGMTGTKYGCGIAQCGACTVHVDGKPAILRSAGWRIERPQHHHDRRHRRFLRRRQSAKGA